MDEYVAFLEDVLECMTKVVDGKLVFRDIHEVTSLENHRDFQAASSGESDLEDENSEGNDGIVVARRRKTSVIGPYDPRHPNYDTNMSKKTALDFLSNQKEKQQSYSLEMQHFNDDVREQLGFIQGERKEDNVTTLDLQADLETARPAHIITESLRPVSALSEVSATSASGTPGLPGMKPRSGEVDTEERRQIDKAKKEVQQFTSQTKSKLLENRELSQHRRLAGSAPHHVAKAMRDTIQSFDEEGEGDIDISAMSFAQPRVKRSRKGERADKTTLARPVSAKGEKTQVFDFGLIHQRRGSGDVLAKRVFRRPLSASHSSMDKYSEENDLTMCVFEVHAALFPLSARAS